MSDDDQAPAAAPGGVAAELQITAEAVVIRADGKKADDKRAGDDG